MTKERKEKAEQPYRIRKPEPAPFIFISHDSRDADLAEAFSKLLRSVSAGMLKSFRWSGKKVTEGIEFGDEWNRALMSKLESVSDVVCLLTERSFERPWILYEAGVAKGKLDKPVFGVALGIPLSKLSTGPFYQFQNCDDSEESLTKLITQVARRIPGLEPDPDVVEVAVRAFKGRCAELLGAGFYYEFPQADIEKIQSLINKLRGLVSSSEELAENHRLRLLRKLEKLQLELHKTVSDFDRFWGFFIDASIVVGLMGENAKPMVEVIKEIVGIIWPTQTRAYDLPSNLPFKLLGHSEED